jgi:hypothetical protein
MGEIKCTFIFIVEKLYRVIHLEDLGVDRIMINPNSIKWSIMVWNRLTELRIGYDMGRSRTWR